VRPESRELVYRGRRVDVVLERCPAQGVEPGDAAPQGDERVEVLHWPVAEADRRLGEIEDAKTRVGLSLLLRTRPG
jgi:hypothetical protein